MKLKKWLDSTPQHVYIVVKAMGKSYTRDNLPSKFLTWQVESADNHLAENYNVDVPKNVEAIEVVNIMKE